MTYQERKAKARATAQEWQRTSAKSCQSWGEVARDTERLYKLAKSCGLVREFRENGII